MPGEFGAGSKLRIFAAAGSIMLEGIVLFTNGFLVAGL